MADENGEVVIMKNNAPCYVLMEFSRFEKTRTAPSEQVESLAEQIMYENDEVFRELAK